MSHKNSTHTFVRGKPRPLKMQCACASVCARRCCEQRAAIGNYAAENGNAAAVKKFKGDFDGQLYRRKYNLAIES